MNNIKFDNFMTYIKKPYFSGETVLKASNVLIVNPAKKIYVSDLKILF